MRDFSRNTRGGSRGGRRFGDRDGGSRPMHRAVCSNCGKDCEVPFRPTGEKPVYCSDCFGDRGGSDSRPSYDRTYRPPQRSGQNNQNQFDMINRKLDKIMEAVKALSPVVEDKSIKANTPSAEAEVFPEPVGVPAVETVPVASNTADDLPSADDLM